jgi:3-oxoacyl-[acyl-carrier-protein] synthase-1
MRRVYFGADNIITSLGFTTEENAENIRAGITGIKPVETGRLFPGKVAYSAVDSAALEKRSVDAAKKLGTSAVEIKTFTRLEKMFITSISGALKKSLLDLSDPGTIMILSTTKGNIDQVQKQIASLHTPPQVRLWAMAGYIAKLFNCHNVPLVVSNACTSGSIAIMQAARLISSGKYDHALVTGGDIISEFVISGFQSFQALSPDPCRPFDADRTGLSLGEGCGTVILTSDPKLAGEGKSVWYLGGASSNDANHISGPSRDGEGLFLAISAAMKEANVTPGDLGFISAHGTATPYNDEMESRALAWAGLEHVPVNSFKGYIGHTLGAAGLIETILSVYSMRHGVLFKSLGYENNGLSRPLNIIAENISQPVNIILKTASGFGGCNAGMVIGS